MTGAVLILGARSDLGRALAKRYARAGYRVHLAARDTDALERDRADLVLRHAVAVSAHAFDALDPAGFEAFVESLPELPGIVICVVGLLGERPGGDADAGDIGAHLRTNFEGPATILSEFARRFEARGSGIIVGVASVAGLRGRASNYVYGSAKAGLTAFLSGLRQRLAASGVRVVTVQPGFMATRMTEGMALPALLTTEPDRAAAVIYRAVRRGRDVVYVPGYWRWVMAAIRCLPETVFKRLDL